MHDWMRTTAVSRATMLRRRARFLGLIVALGSAVGCTPYRGEKVNSTDVRTTGVYADFSISNTGNGYAEVQARLRTGTPKSNTFLVLTSKDRLLVHVGSDSFVMQDAGDEDGQHYGTIFPIPVVSVDIEVHVTFERGSDDRTVRNSSVMVPADFMILPLPGQEFSRDNDPLEVNWTPSDPSQDVDVALTGDCFDDISLGQADSGTATFPPGSLRDSPPPKPGANRRSCLARFQVTKSRDGHVDPTFAGGSLNAVARRACSFLSKP